MSNIKSIIKSSTLIAAVVLIGGYSLYEGRNIIRGPVLEIFQPSDGSAIQNPLVEIKGATKNISSISINDREITVDQEGVFNEKLLLSPGYNTVKLEASDRFGRTTEKILELVLTEHESLVLTESQEIN